MQMSAQKAAPAASPTQTLSAFLSTIRYKDIPQPVVACTGKPFPDRLASALVGKRVRMAMSAPSVLMHARQNLIRRIDPA